jgi:methionine synthase II (cobalamin-independent)
LPHTQAEEACRLVLAYLPAIPAWPQLPKRSFLENMYVQFSQGFPGVVIDREAERIYIERSSALEAALEQLYTAYLEGMVDRYTIEQDYAAGLQAFLSLEVKSAAAIKGQVTGPISWGLSVTDQERRSILYDETLADAVAKHLRLKAAWQERALRRLSAKTIIFVDEPYLASLGSAFISIPQEQVTALLTEVLQGLSGIKGLHCCGNTDWGLLLGIPIDILSFDTYNYAQNFSLYPAEIRTFLERGGAIAWGIVPNEEQALSQESVSSLKDRLEEAMAPLTRKGIRFQELIEQSLLTPSCGLSGLSPEAAAQALEMLAELSVKLRKRYWS